jgi:uncharacterized protein YbjT (DUF2867 family)
MPSEADEQASFLYMVSLLMHSLTSRPTAIHALFPVMVAKHVAHSPWQRSRRALRAAAWASPAPYTALENCSMLFSSAAIASARLLTASGPRSHQSIR